MPDGPSRGRHDAARYALARRFADGLTLWWTGAVADGASGKRLLRLSTTAQEAMTFPTAAEARDILACWMAAFADAIEGVDKLEIVELPPAEPAPAEPAPAEQPAAAGAAVHKGAVAAPNLGGWRP